MNGFRSDTGTILLVVLFPFTAFNRTRLVTRRVDGYRFRSRWFLKAVKQARVHNPDEAVMLSCRLQLLCTYGFGKLFSVETHNLKVFFEDDAPSYFKGCRGNARHHAGNK